MCVEGGNEGMREGGEGRRERGGGGRERGGERMREREERERKTTTHLKIRLCLLSAQGSYKLNNQQIHSASPHCL